jgi:micrococcal nuclease
MSSANVQIPIRPKPWCEATIADHRTSRTHHDVRGNGTSFCTTALVVVCATTLSACTPPERSVQTVATARIIEVVDGDTFTADISGRRETVRLLGIDAPETKHPRRPVECWGPQSAELLRSLLPAGATVDVRRDVVARDYFGRLLLYVWRGDGMFVNVELVERGAARPLTIAPNGAHNDAIVAAAFRAHAGRRGWWADCAGGASLGSPP